MEPLRMAVAGAAVAVERVQAAVAAMPVTVQMMAGRELSALSLALVAITRAQSAIREEIEGVRRELEALKRGSDDGTC